MSSPSATADAPPARAPGRLELGRAGLAAAALAAGVVGALAGGSPALGLAAVGALLVVAVTFSRPALGAAAVAFLLWANVPVVAVRSHGVPLPLAAGYLLLLLVPAAHYIVRERRSLSVTPALPWVLAFVAVSLLSAVGSRDASRSLEDVLELVLEGLVVFILALHAVRDRATLRQVTWALMAAGAFMGTLAVVQQVTGNFGNDFGGFALIDSGFRTGEITTRGVGSQPRLAGPIGEKNRFAQLMLCLVALGVGLARAERRPALRRLAVLAAGLSAMGAALTFSRGNAVAFAGLIVCMLGLGTVSRRQVGLLVALGAVMLLALPQYRARLATLTSVFLLMDDGPSAERPDGAIRGRATQVLAAGLVFVDHPVLGVGPGLFRTYAQEYGNPLGIRRLKTEREAHSLLPHIASETGALGLAAFLALLGVTMRDLRRRARAATDPEDRELANAYLLALLAYLLSGLFLHMAFIRYFWFLVALASAATALPLAPARVGARAATPLEGSGR